MYQYLPQYLSLGIVILILSNIYIISNVGVQDADARIIIDLNENGYQVVAGVTGLEPATSCVTGRRSNQLNYSTLYRNGGRNRA